MIMGVCSELFILKKMAIGIFEYRKQCWKVLQAYMISLIHLYLWSTLLKVPENKAHMN